MKLARISRRLRNLRSFGAGLQARHAGMQRLIAVAVPLPASSSWKLETLCTDAWSVALTMWGLQCIKLLAQSA